LTLDHAAVRTDALLVDLGSLLPLEVPLEALHDVALDSAHVVAHLGDPQRLEERDQLLLIHLQILGDLVDPLLAHAPRSTFAT
jgi:hypothetical protein